MPSLDWGLRYMHYNNGNLIQVVQGQHLVNTTVSTLVSAL